MLHMFFVCIYIYIYILYIRRISPPEIKSVITKSDRFLAETEDAQVEIRKSYFKIVARPRIEKMGEDSIYTVEQHFIKKYPIRSYEKFDSNYKPNRNFLVFLVPPVVLWVFFYICVWIASGFKKDNSVKNNKEE